MESGSDTGRLLDRVVLEQETIGALLRARAEEDPDKILISHDSGSLSYRDVYERSSALAAALGELGVGHGDSVSLMCPNTPEYIVSWMAAARLGAVKVGLNTEYRDDGLVHLITLSASELVIVHASLLESVLAIEKAVPDVRHIVVIGEPAEGSLEARMSRSRFAGAWTSYADALTRQPQEVDADVQCDDLLTLIFTSGTTGPAKAVSVSHAFCLDEATHLIDKFGYRRGDVIYTCYPLFHTDAAILTYVVALVLGATAALGRPFSARGFWDDIRRHGATIFDFMGAVIAILHKQPPSPKDREHAVRIAMGGPKPPIWPEFEERFGIRLLEVYGSTEQGHVSWDPLEGERPLKACGRIDTERYDVRIVDDHMRELPPGAVGSIVTRPKFTNQHMSGYFRDSEETSRAWKGLWYHTRDLGRIDEEGWLYYEGRSSDTIRKRGNNMSAHEIESVMNAHPEVIEAVAVGVPSELTEEDVLALLRVRGASVEFDRSAFHEWCRARMPKYMVPRYIKVEESIPKSSTGKVRKKEIKDTWEEGIVYDCGDGRR